MCDNILSGTVMGGGLRAFENVLDISIKCSTCCFSSTRLRNVQDCLRESATDALLVILGMYLQNILMCIVNHYIQCVVILQSRSTSGHTVNWCIRID